MQSAMEQHLEHVRQHFDSPIASYAPPPGLLFNHPAQFNAVETFVSFRGVTAMCVPEAPDYNSLCLWLADNRSSSWQSARTRHSVCWIQYRDNPSNIVSLPFLFLQLSADGDAYSSSVRMALDLPASIRICSSVLYAPPSASDAWVPRPYAVWHNASGRKLGSDVEAQYFHASFMEHEPLRVLIEDYGLYCLTHQHLVR